MNLISKKLKLGKKRYFEIHKCYFNISHNIIYTPRDNY